MVAKLQYIHDMLVFYPGKVVNRPSRSSLNHSKPLQTSIIFENACGPVTGASTSISNQIQVDQDYIAKSLSMVRSQVKPIADITGLVPGEFFRPPVLTQPLLAGRNVRCHCFDSVVHGCAVASDEIDYRFDSGVTMRTVDIPSAVQQWCVSSARSEQLLFAGIDFIVTDEQKWVCLEVNPEPGYHYFENCMLAEGENPALSDNLLALLADLGSADEKMANFNSSK
jgi:hypothetical protein